MPKASKTKWHWVNNLPHIYHWVRDEREYFRIADYIECNPVKAGLVGHAGDYPWSSAHPDQRLDTIVEAAECAQHGQNLIG